MAYPHNLSSVEESQDLANIPRSTQANDDDTEYQELLRQRVEGASMSIEDFDRLLSRSSAYCDAHHPEASEHTTMSATHDSTHIDDPFVAEGNTPVEHTNSEEKSTTGDHEAPPPGPDNQLHGSPFTPVHERYLLYLVRKHTLQNAQGRRKCNGPH